MWIPETPVLRHFELFRFILSINQSIHQYDSPSVSQSINQSVIQSVMLVLERCVV